MEYILIAIALAVVFMIIHSQMDSSHQTNTPSRVVNPTPVKAKNYFDFHQYKSSIRKLLAQKAKNKWLSDAEFKVLVSLRKDPQFEAEMERELKELQDHQGLLAWIHEYTIELGFKRYPDNVYQAYMEKQAELASTELSEWELDDLAKYHRLLNSRYINDDLYKALQQAYESKSTEYLLGKLARARNLENWMERMKKEHPFISNEVYHAWEGRVK